MTTLATTSFERLEILRLAANSTCGTDNIMKLANEMEKFVSNGGVTIIQGHHTPNQTTPVQKPVFKVVKKSDFQKERLTPRQEAALDALKTLAGQGSERTASNVSDIIGTTAGNAYQLLDALRQKNYVTASKDGRAHIFTPITFKTVQDNENTA